MFPGSSGRGWNSLTSGQKIFIGIMGALVLYAVTVTLTSGAGLGRYSDPSWWLAGFSIIALALPIHEFAHAWMATRLGDPTPRMQGRLTLNPAAHVDPVGAVLILLFGFGWARPVQWNPGYIRINQRLGRIMVAFAGPLSNLILAILALMIWSVVSSVLTFNFTIYDTLTQFMFFFVYINVLLFVFNLLPLPPLDGSHILFAVLPDSMQQFYGTLAQFGFFLVFGIAYLAPWVIQVPASIILSTLFQFFQI